MRSFYRLLIFSFLIALTRSTVAQSAGAISFLLNPDRPLAYLQFDHFGILKLSVDSPRRYWLRFVNNSTIPMEIISVGQSPDVPQDEIQIQYRVVLEGRRFHGPGPDPCQMEFAQIPMHTPADAVLPIRVDPGQSILFNVPEIYLNKCWHIEIPFAFALSESKEIRHDDIGGRPVMNLHYGLYDLPEKIREEHYPK